MKISNKCISFLAVLGSCSTLAAGVKSDAIVSRRAAVADYVLTWEGCDKALGDISAADKPNIFCKYDMLPATQTYKAELFGWSGTEGDACAGTAPPMVAFVGQTSGMYTSTALAADDPQGTNSVHPATTDGQFFTDIDIDRNEFLNGGGEETFHFCIRHDVMEDLDQDNTPETSLYFMKTFITVRFFLDGSFELNADSEGTVGANDDVVYTGDDDVLFPPSDDQFVGQDDGNTNFNDDLFDDDEGPGTGGGINVTENVTASEVFDEFNKTYSVFAYQCEVDPPHNQTDRIIYQGDNLGVCVETLFRDTQIDGVNNLQLVQDNNAGGEYTTKPVDNGADNVVTESTCALDSRIGEDNSKCFIKTAMLSQFYVTQNIVNATGDVDLKIRLTPTNRHLLDALRNLQAIDGSYVVSARVGELEDVEQLSQESGAWKFSFGYGIVVAVLFVVHSI